MNEKNILKGALEKTANQARGIGWSQAGHLERGEKAQKGLDGGLDGVFRDKKGEKFKNWMETTNLATQHRTTSAYD